MTELLIGLADNGIHPDLKTWTKEKIFFFVETLNGMRMRSR